MWIPLFEGRWLEPSDGPEAPAVGRINHQLAERLFPGRCAASLLPARPAGKIDPVEVLGRT